MSSAGTPFKEKTFDLDLVGTGVQTIGFVLEAEGVLLSVQRVGGGGTLGIETKTRLPIPMTYISHGRIDTSIADPVQDAYIAGRKIELNINWVGTGVWRILATPMTAVGIQAWKEENALPDTSVAEFNNGVLSMLANLKQQQEIMINHLRQITDINEDKGDIY